MKKSVSVIGCGIIGLTTALKLQEKGFKVRIIAEQCFNKTLSSKVGAIWFPFEIYPKEKANNWAALAYEVYRLDIRKGNGVTFIPFITAFDTASNTDWIQQMPKGAVRIASLAELPGGTTSAYVSIVPLAEPSLYLPYLFTKFLTNGGTFEERTVSCLKEEAASLTTWVVNCTGLGARKLCDDLDLRPMRGQILRCKKVGFTSYADSTKKGALSYVINRSEDCVIGGTDYENDWNIDIDKRDTHLITGRLLAGGFSKNAPEIIEEIVGLRPKRSAVRFEFDAEVSNVFHNYGHGGAGFTVAWGCAIELADILSKS